MKKITAIIAAALLLQVNAFAAVPDGETDYSDKYYAVENTLDIETDDDFASTVLIVKVDSSEDTAFEDSDIVFVDQSDSTFSSASGFLIKENPEEGLYKVILGSESGSAVVSYFEIGTAIKTTDVAMTGSDVVKYTDSEGNEVYKKGFLVTVKADDFTSYQGLKLVYDQVIGAWSLENTPDFDNTSTVTTGGADIVLGVQINNIPNKETADGLLIYLSDDTVEEVTE